MIDKAAPNSSRLPASKPAGVRQALERGNHVRAAILLVRSRPSASSPVASSPVGAILQPLVSGLAEVLELQPAQRDRLGKLLVEMLGRAAKRRFTNERRILFGLQHLLDDAIDPNPYDYVEWLRTWGRRPVVRRRKILQRVLVVRRLRRIVGRAARLSTKRGQQLAGLLREPLTRLDQQAREVVETAVAAAAHEAGLVANGPAEQASFDDLVAALTDRALEKGTLDFMQLRDAVAAHRVRLQELSWRRFWLGDELLRFDVMLAERLDGVHRRGELYLRVLQRMQSIAFGTPWGRAASLWVLFPLAGSFVLFSFGGYLATQLGVGDELTLGQILGALLIPLILVAALMSVLANVRALRLRAGRAVARFMGLFSSKQKQLPPQSAQRGRTAAWVQWIVRSWTRLIGLMDTTFQRGDELLRFGTTSDRKGKLKLRAGLAVAWFLIAYIVRFLIVLVVEPTINPVKHFPWVTVAGKLSIGLGIPVMVTSSLSVVMPVGLAGLIGFYVGIFVVPGFVGFLVWELKENYRLFRVNASRYLRPVAMGPHGETVLRLLRRGFHSGTLPKLFDRLAAAHEDEDEDAVNKEQLELEEIERAMRRFVERRLVRMLEQSSSIEGRGLELRDVQLSPDAIVLVCGHPEVLAAPSLVLRFFIQQRDLILELQDAGSTRDLSAQGRTTLQAALLGLAAHAQGAAEGQQGVLQLEWDVWDAFWRDEVMGNVEPLAAARGTFPELCAG